MSERYEQSLCWNVWQLGWVSDQDFKDDAEASEMWPESIRNLYYGMSGTMVQQAYESTWGYFLFFGTAYWYIQAINGLDALKELRGESWKMLAWLPFLGIIVPAFLVGCYLHFLKNSRGVDK